MKTEEPVDGISIRCFGTRSGCGLPGAGDKPPRYISSPHRPLWIPAFAGRTTREICGIPWHYRNRVTPFLYQHLPLPTPDRGGGQAPALQSSVDCEILIYSSANRAKVT